MREKDIINYDLKSLLCLCRKKLSIKEDVAMSANVAYKDVTWIAEEREREYESLDDIILSQQQPVRETAAATTDCTSESISFKIH